MTTNNDDLKFNLPGWKIAWNIYSKENFLKSLIIPSITSVLILIVCLLATCDSFELLVYLTDLIITIVPAILGFTLSGYALIMGLSNSEFIKALKNFSLKDKKYSLFQSLNATFAMVLGVLFVTIFISIVVGIMTKVEIPFNFYQIIVVCNWIVFFILVFLLTYTINSIKDVVVNIFNFGQFAQIYDDKDNSEHEDITK